MDRKFGGRVSSLRVIRKNEVLHWDRHTVCMQVEVLQRIYSPAGILAFPADTAVRELKSNN